MAFLSTIRRLFSHVGSRPIEIEKDVSIECIRCPSTTRMLPNYKRVPVVAKVAVRGPLGELHFPLHKGLNVTIVDSDDSSRTLTITRDDLIKANKHQEKFVKSMWGTTNAILRHLIEGVTEGHSVSLRLVGVGFRAAIVDRELVLRIGFSHPINLPIPKEVKVATPLPTKIVITGIDLQKITQFAARIRSFKKPEPYNCKGIFVGDETITKKEGKKK